MKKYIIKNCPNLLFKKGIPACGLTWELTSPNEYFDIYKYCQDISDCLLKRIVAGCKETLDIMRLGSGRNMYAGGRCIEAERVLDFLEIEEVNE